MKFSELKKSLNSEIFPVYYLEGEDAFFRERAVKILKDKCLENEDFNYSYFEGSSVKENAEELMSALQSVPFMSPKRVVLIRDYYPTQNELKNSGLLSYFDNPQGETLLIIVNQDVCEILKKQQSVTYVDCGKGDISLLTMWVKNELNKNGYKVADSTISLLIDYCQCDMAKIVGETEKLVCYCGGEDVVTENDVKAIVVKDVEYKVYEAVESISKGNYDEAYRIITDLTDKNTEEQKIFSSIYAHFRRLFFVSIDKRSDAEIASDLQVKEYAVKMAKKQAVKFSPVKLKRILDYLGELDEKYKSGKILIDNALWNSVFEIMIK